VKAPAFLLAAGFGTRLRPLTEHRPKPLVPLCGLPLLDQSVALLRKHGIQQAVVNAHHLPGALEEWADSCDMDLHVSVEAPQILGTGGGLVHAVEHLADSFVILNGDVACDIDLGRLFMGLTSSLATMVLRVRQPGERYGLLATDAQERVVDLVGLAQAEPQGEVRKDRHFTGIHGMRREALELIPAQQACVVRTAYKELVPDRQVAAQHHDGLWLDLGDPARYLRANRMVLRDEVLLPLHPWDHVAWGIRLNGREVGQKSSVEIDSTAALVGPIWMGPGASVGANVRLGSEVVLGAGCRIGAGSRLRRCVVWDGAEVPAETVLEDAIVHDGGVLELF
jgi:NDP-sugar pyrophosphorylase family protein